MIRPTYAVSWRDRTSPRSAGRLELRPTHVRVTGRSADGAETTRSYRYAEIRGVESARAGGRREIVVALDDHDLAITVVAGAGVLSELLWELRRRTLSPHAEPDVTPIRA